MNSQEFCYWLQGFFELSEGKKLTPKQVKIIKDHLALVFTKITPDRTLTVKSEPSLEDIMKLILEGRKLSEQSPGIVQPINPWPAPYPGVIPGISPMMPPYIVTCSTSEPKIPDSRPDCSLFNDPKTDEVYC